MITRERIHDLSRAFFEIAGMLQHLGNEDDETLTGQAFWLGRLREAIAATNMSDFEVIMQRVRDATALEPANDQR